MTRSSKNSFNLTTRGCVQTISQRFCESTGIVWITHRVLRLLNIFQI